MEPKQIAEIKEGMKFINPTKKRWPYQISCVDGEIIVVSWIQEGDIVSTLYELWEIKRYVKNGTWILADPKTSVNHV